VINNEQIIPERLNSLLIYWKFSKKYHFNSLKEK
jgi:hypothetical protein